MPQSHRSYLCKSFLSSEGSNSLLDIADYPGMLDADDALVWYRYPGAGLDVIVPGARCCGLDGVRTFGLSIHLEVADGGHRSGGSKVADNSGRNC